MRLLAICLIRCYQWTISPFLGPCCRFQPSCSHYAARGDRPVRPAARRLARGAAHRALPSLASRRARSGARRRCSALPTTLMNNSPRFYSGSRSQSSCGSTTRPGNASIRRFRPLPARLPRVRLCRPNSRARWPTPFPSRSSPMRRAAQRRLHDRTAASSSGRCRRGHSCCDTYRVCKCAADPRPYGRLRHQHQHPRRHVGRGAPAQVRGNQRAGGSGGARERRQPGDGVSVAERTHGIGKLRIPESRRAVHGAAAEL